MKRRRRGISRREPYRADISPRATEQRREGDTMYGKTLILVTGGHRSGTTWVGNTLAAAPRTAYIQEPFNPGAPYRHTEFRARIWFERLAAPARDEASRSLGRLFNLQWMRKEFRASQGRRVPPLTRSRVANKLLAAVRQAMLRAAVIKDPLALFSADWLVERFGVRPVVMIRHPAAFVSSLLLKGWRFSLGEFLKQRHAIDEFFPEERERIERADRERKVDALTEAAILWTLIHKAILVYRRRHPEWVYLRHEDVSRDPEQRFRELYAKLGLPFTPEVRKFLKDHTQAHDRAELTTSTDPSDIVRDSQANIRAWSKRLAPAEIETVRDLCEPVASEFYSDSDW
ncbi:MAG TPA: sulfotransferase [Planctomycetia bacterium]|nr:sulfotransferase [Planctomycetia bacterium]